MFLIHVDFVQSHRWAAEPSELGFRETALAHDGAVYHGFTHVTTET
jgi:hypothetical protein